MHDCKLRVDGITKYLDNQQFEFDHSFGEDSSTKEVYFYVGQPLVSYVVRGGRATCFAYGQTGSGKTHTMVGIQEMAVNDLFEEMDHFSDLNDVEIFVSFYEIYGGRCQDLLNHRHRLVVREDGKGEVHIAGLQECCVTSGAQLLSLVAKGNQLRTTQATETNDTSSRSHCVTIHLRPSSTGQPECSVWPSSIEPFACLYAKRSSWRGRGVITRPPRVNAVAPPRAAVSQNAIAVAARWPRS